ncbi:MAG: hypothetical protein ACI81V_000600 [Lentimonas sp.]|jgi:uncharacterized protein HemY
MSTPPQHRAIVINETAILLGFVVRQKLSDASVRVVIRWRRLMATCVTLFALAWLSLAAILFYHFKYQKDFDDVSYAGMVTLPFRLDAHREEMGNYHIKSGIAAIEEQDYRNGFRLLRMGVVRAPSNLEGRGLVAEFYEIALTRPDLATEVMLSGLKYGGQEDIKFLKQTLSLLLRQQMDDEVIELAETILPKKPELTDLNRIIAFAAANASHLRGNYDKADDYLSGYQLLNSLDGVILSSRISWDRGNQLAAIEKLEASLRKYPNSEVLLMQLISNHLERDELDEARRYAILRNINNPLNYSPRIELLQIYNKSGDTERETREIERMLDLFSEDEKAMQSLANFAAETGNVGLARHVYEKTLENEFDISTCSLLLIESHLVSRDYAGALKFADELIKERPDWLDQNAAIFGSLRAISAYAMNRPDLGEIYLKEFIENNSNKPGTYLAVARRLQAIDLSHQARQILLIAYERNPENQKILTELLKTELALGNTKNLNKLLSDFLQTRRPQINLISAAYKSLSSDRFMFTEGRDGLLLQLSAILRENGHKSIDFDS